jgi:uncharacterized protein YuzE
MRIHADEQADAMYLRLDESPIVESEEIRPGIVLDFDEHDQVIGIEILCVKGRVPLAILTQVDVEIAGATSTQYSTVTLTSSSH